MTEPNEPSTPTGGSAGTGASGTAGGPRRQDPLGSAAEEAMKLFDAVQQRMARELGKGIVKGGMSGLGSVFGGGAGGTGSGSGFGGGLKGGGDTEDVWSDAVTEGHGDEYICRACPVCRVIAARKEAGGDVTDHLLAAGGELFAAFRQAMDALQRPHSRPGPRVEHIDLG
jgi:hypothetical protein